MSEPIDRTGVATLAEYLEAIWAPGFHSLCAQKEPGGEFYTVGLPSSPAELVEMVKTAKPKLTKQHSVWVGENGMAEPPKKRGAASDITAVLSLPADFDWFDPVAHESDRPDEDGNPPKNPNPTEAYVRAAVAMMEPQPSITVNSGYGFQLHWLLDEVADPAEAREVADGLWRHIRACYGLSNDRKDLASVLRMPTSWNPKDPENPVQVTIEHFNADQTYSLNEIRENYWLESEHPSTRVARAERRGSGLGPESFGHRSVLHEHIANEIGLETLLTEANFTYSYTDQDGASHWIRPRTDGKRHPAISVMPSGLTMLWSSKVDPVFLDTAIDGENFKWLSPLGVYAVVRHAGDVDAAIEELRESDEVIEDLLAKQYLPDEFWELTDTLRQIRDDAIDAELNPDALLLVDLSRVACSVPAGSITPGGSPIPIATTPYVLAGPSGASKGSTVKRSKHHIPLAIRELGLKTGAAFRKRGFYEDKTIEVPAPTQADPNRKKKEKVTVRRYDPVIFVSHEANDIKALYSDTGAELLSHLKEFFSGERMGGDYASDDSNLPVDELSYTGSVILSAAPAASEPLFRDRGAGLPERMVFMHALPRVIANTYKFGCDHDSALPGWETSSKHTHERTAAAREQKAVTDVGGKRLRRMAEDPEIEVVAMSLRREIQKGIRDGYIDELDAQRPAVTRKLAHQLALLHRESPVTVEHWRMATIVLDVSAEVRAWLDWESGKRRREQNANRRQEAVETEAAIGFAKQHQLSDMHVRFLGRVDAAKKGADGWVRQAVVVNNTGQRETCRELVEKGILEHRDVPTEAGGSHRSEIRRRGGS